MRGRTFSSLLKVFAPPADQWEDIGTEVFAELLVRNTTKSTILGHSIGIANTSRQRRRGLLKHNTLKPGEGLWIAPCESVHTFGMKFPIDIIYLNRKRKVLKVRRNMVRRRISACLRAHSVLELPAGMSDETRTEPGDQLEFDR